MPTPHVDPEWIKWLLKVAAYALFAALGGVLGHIMRAYDRNEKIQYVRAGIEGAAAGFVGMLIYFACLALSLSEQWTGVVVGLAGWLGANASIRIVEALVYKRLGLTKSKKGIK